LAAESPYRRIVAVAAQHGTTGGIPANADNPEPPAFAPAWHTPGSALALRLHVRPLWLYTVPARMAERGREAWTRPMFAAGGRTVALGEIVLAAHCRGDLLAAWTQLLQLVECEARAADADDDGALADDSVLQSLSEQFRYDRDLITAEETERWLADRGLTLDDFSAYCVRHYWADRAGDADASTPMDYESAPDELWDLLRAELLLTGELDRMALALSWRFAAAHAVGAAHASNRGEGSTQAVVNPSVEQWMERLGCDSPMLDEILRLEAAYQAHRDGLMTPERIQRTIGSLRLALSRVDLETIDVDSLDAAHEVVMCVRVDGRALAEVASDGGLPYERSAVLFEDLAPELQQRVVSAASGDVLAPLPHVEGFHVHRLIARSEPDADDEQVRARVEREVLARHFSELSASCIRWVLAPSVRS